MGFFKNIATCFQKYFQFKGVASRHEFWFFLLFVVILLCFTLIIDGAYLGPLLGGEDVMAFDADAGKWLSLIFLILLIPPLIAVSVRRAHDSNFSGWVLLLAFIFAIFMFVVMHWVMSLLPYSSKEAIGQFIPLELLYFTGFIPILYIFGKSGVKKGNRYQQDL